MEKQANIAAICYCNRRGMNMAKQVSFVRLIDIFGEMRIEVEQLELVSLKKPERELCDAVVQWFGKFLAALETELIFAYECEFEVPVDANDRKEVIARALETAENEFSKGHEHGKARTW